MGRPSQEPRDAVRAQNVARILALMRQQHMHLKDKRRGYREAKVARSV